MGLSVSHSRQLWNESCHIVGLEHFLAEPPEPSSEEEDGPSDWRAEDSDDLEDTMETLQLVGLEDLHNL